MLVEGKLNKDRENLDQWLFDHLITAAVNGETETAKMLCEAGAQVNRRREEYPNITALHIASEKGNLYTTEYLIKEAKADVNIGDECDETALHLAARKGRTDIVHLLCDHDANIDSKGYTGWTALHYASERGHLSTAQCLAGRGASLNQQDDNGETPVHLSSLYGYVSIVAWLLENGAEDTIENKRGETARDIAERYCHNEKRNEIISFWNKYSSRQ